MVECCQRLANCRSIVRFGLIDANRPGRCAFHASHRRRRLCSFAGEHTCKGPATASLGSSGTFLAACCSWKDGEENDFILAYTWLSLAISVNMPPLNDEKEMIALRDAIAQHLSDSEKARGQKLIAEWNDKHGRAN